MTLIFLPAGYVSTIAATPLTLASMSERKTSLLCKREELAKLNYARKETRKKLAVMCFPGLSISHAKSSVGEMKVEGYKFSGYIWVTLHKRDDDFGFGWTHFVRLYILSGRCFLLVG